MKAELYPFLVASSKLHEHSTVLYPDFMDNENNYIIARNAGTNKHEVYYFKCISLLQQNYYLLYKSVVAMSSFIDADAKVSAPLADEQNRFLFLTGGVLFKDENAVKFLDEIYMANIFNEYLYPAYKNFYNADIYFNPAKSLKILFEASEIKHLVYERAESAKIFNEKQAAASNEVAKQPLRESAKDVVDWGCKNRVREKKSLFGNKLGLLGIVILIIFFLLKLL